MVNSQFTVFLFYRYVKCLYKVCILHIQNEGFLSLVRQLSPGPQDDFGSWPNFCIFCQLPSSNQRCFPGKSIIWQTIGIIPIKIQFFISWKINGIIIWRFNPIKKSSNPFSPEFPRHAFLIDRLALHQGPEISPPNPPGKSIARWRKSSIFQTGANISALSLRCIYIYMIIKVYLNR